MPDSHNVIIVSGPWVGSLTQNEFFSSVFGKTTGCPTKNYTLFWRAVAPLNFELGIKVGGVLELSGSQLSQVGLG